MESFPSCSVVTVMFRWKTWCIRYARVHTVKDMLTKKMQRNLWASEFEFCWVCGGKDYQGWPLETHEIERRSHAPKTCMHECNYFRACKKCHMDDLAAMPHAQQLAYKKEYDPERFDLEQWLRLRDPELRAPNRVTTEEVAEWSRKLFP